MVGGLLGAALPTRAIGIGGGLLFLGFALEPPRTTATTRWTMSARRPRVRPRRRRLGGCAMFVAELGDKTMLATATLAAQGNPVLTGSARPWGSSWPAPSVCSSAGRSAPACPSGPSGGLGVLFALFGVALIATNL